MFGIQVDFSEMVTITYIVLAGEFNDGEGTRFTQKFRVEYQRTEQGPWISYISPITGQVSVLPQGNMTLWCVILEKGKTILLCYSLRSFILLLR